MVKIHRYRGPVSLQDFKASGKNPAYSQNAQKGKRYNVEDENSKCYYRRLPDADNIQGRVVSKVCTGEFDGFGGLKGNGAGIAGGSDRKSGPASLSKTPA